MCIHQDSHKNVAGFFLSSTVLVGQVAARRTLTTWSLPKAPAMPMAWAPVLQSSDLGGSSQGHE